MASRTWATCFALTQRAGVFLVRYTRQYRRILAARFNLFVAQLSFADTINPALFRLAKAGFPMADVPLSCVPIPERP